MSDRRGPRAVREVPEAFQSPHAAAAFSLITFGLAFATPAIRSIIGWPGLIGALVVLVVLGIGILIARRDAIEWHGLLPISILIFIGWCGLSAFWTEYQWVTASSVLYQAAFAFLGITIVLTRDLIQIVRSVGTVLRFLLVLSFGVEILSGLILDVPFRFLGVDGALALGGPIQGIFGTRNMLGFVALIAIVTFVIEWRTRSITRGLFIFSAILGGAALLFSGSPVTWLVVTVLLFATLALYGLRKAKPDVRLRLQWALLGLTVVGTVATYLARVRVINLLNVGSEFEYRYSLWIQMWQLIPVHPLEGWGWAGFWRTGIPPFANIDFALSQGHSTGLNAFLDVYLQVGLVGLLAFIALIGLAFVRSWLLASNRRVVTYTWPALVLVVVIATSAAESFALLDAGWLLLVVCAANASQGQSWRRRLRSKEALVPQPPLE